MSRPHACPVCGGSGEHWHTSNGVTTGVCRACNGKGIVWEPQDDGSEPFRGQDRPQANTGNDRWMPVTMRDDFRSVTGTGNVTYDHDDHWTAI